MHCFAYSIQIVSLSFKYVKFYLLLWILMDDSFVMWVVSRVCIVFVLYHFFLFGGEFSEHFLVFLLLLFGDGLRGGFFSHLNDYYKRDQQYKSDNHILGRIIMKSDRTTRKTDGYIIMDSLMQNYETNSGSKYAYQDSNQGRIWIGKSNTRIGRS